MSIAESKDQASPPSPPSPPSLHRVTAIVRIVLKVVVALGATASIFFIGLSIGQTRAIGVNSRTLMLGVAVSVVAAITSFVIAIGVQAFARREAQVHVAKLSILLEQWLSARSSGGSPDIGELGKAAMLPLGSLVQSYFASRGLYLMAGAIVGLLANLLVLAQLVVAQVQADRLEVQNNLIAQQTHLLEAQRRAGLVIELTSVLEQLDQMVSGSTETTPTSAEGTRTPRERLFHGRVVALSKSLQPYRYVTAFGDSPGLQSRPLSPERAQLLTALVSAGIDLKHILNGADFRYSDLSNVQLSLGSKTLDLSDVDLSWASLKDANLFNVKLCGSRLTDADLTAAMLNSAELGNAAMVPGGRHIAADMRRAILRDASLSMAKLHGVDGRGADFTNANLSGADLGGSLLQGAVFRGAYLADVKFANDQHPSGADLTGADFDGAILGWVGEYDDYAKEWLRALSKLDPEVRGLDQNQWKVVQEPTPKHWGSRSDEKAWVLRRRE
jgi:uncharacterized protein YjbI with pentapeptide repeats